MTGGGSLILKLLVLVFLFIACLNMAGTKQRFEDRKAALGLSHSAGLTGGELNSFVSDTLAELKEYRALEEFKIEAERKERLPTAEREERERIAKAECEEREKIAIAECEEQEKIAIAEREERDKEREYQLKLAQLNVEKPPKGDSGLLGGLRGHKYSF